MSLKITGLVENPARLVEGRDQSVVASPFELIDFFNEKIGPLCGESTYYEDAIEAIDKFNIPFKFQLMTLGVGAYIERKYPLKTTEKIVKLLAEKGYLYHASLIASSQSDFSSLLEPICLPVFNKLEKYGKCKPELESLKLDIRSIDDKIEFISVHHFNEALALLPFVSHPEYREASIEVAIRKLSDAGRVDEARSVISLLNDRCEAKKRSYLFIIKALAKLGDIYGALRSVPELQNVTYEDEARSDIVAALSKDGRIAEAIPVFESMKNPYIREQATLSLLISIIEQSKSDPSQLDSALELLRSVSYFPSLIELNRRAQVAKVTSLDVKKDLILALLRENRIENAKTVFVAEIVPNHQALLGLVIVENFLSQGQVADARAILEEFSENSLFQDKGKVALIKYNIKAFIPYKFEIKSLVEQIESMYHELTANLHKELSNTNIFEERAEQREKYMALKEEVDEKCFLLEDEISAKIKPLDESMELLSGIKDVNERSLALASIMDAFLKAGCIDRAKLAFSQLKKANFKVLYPVLRHLILVLIGQNKENEAIEVVDQVLDTQTEAMLSLPILNALVDKGELNKALEHLDEISQSERCLNGIKFKLAESLIRKNHRITFAEENVLIRNGRGHSHTFISIIRAFRDVGDISKAVFYLIYSLPMQADQDPLSDITIEMLKDLVSRNESSEVSRINSLILDETLQEKVVRAFKEIGRIDQAVEFLKGYLIKSQEQVLLSEVILEVIEDLVKMEMFSQISELRALIKEKSVLDKFTPIIESSEDEVVT
jgi:tetratricopeptide (TPR) repeat protein